MRFRKLDTSTVLSCCCCFFFFFFFFCLFFCFVFFLRQEIRARFRASKTGLGTFLFPQRSFPTDRPKAVPLLRFLFVCASVVSYVAFVLSFRVPQLSIFWYIGKVVLRDCSISWVSSLIVLWVYPLLSRFILFRIHLYPADDSHVTSTHAPPVYLSVRPSVCLHHFFSISGAILIINIADLTRLALGAVFPLHPPHISLTLSLLGKKNQKRKV